MTSFFLSFIFFIMFRYYTFSSYSYLSTMYHDSCHTSYHWTSFLCRLSLPWLSLEWLESSNTVLEQHPWDCCRVFIHTYCKTTCSIKKSQFFDWLRFATFLIECLKLKFWTQVFFYAAWNQKVFIFFILLCYFVLSFILDLWTCTLNRVDKECCFSHWRAFQSNASS